MARASRKTPQRIEAVREDLAAGLGLRAIARKRSIPVTTLQRWVADLPETKATKRADREGAVDRAKNTEKPEENADPGAIAAVGSIAQSEVDALLRAPRPEGLDDLRERLGLLRGLLLRLESAVERETFSATSYVQLSKYGDELSVRIAELTPPAAPDPEQDPDTRESERVLVSRLERMVTEAEARSLPCSACGRRRAPGEVRS